MSLGSDTSFFITSETLRSLVEDAPADRGHDQERIINLISLNISEQLRRIRVLDIDHLALFLSLIALDSSNFSQIENDSSTSFSARGLLKICGRANYKKFG